MLEDKELRIRRLAAADAIEVMASRVNKKKVYEGSALHAWLIETALNFRRKADEYER